MGVILQGQCECGFETENLFIGGGMLDFTSICYLPAVCLNCNIFLVKNYNKKYSKKLMKAIYRNNYRAVKKCLKKKADPNATYRGWSALMVAVYKKNYKIVKILLKKKADVNYEFDGWTPIKLAKKKKNKKILKLVKKSKSVGPFSSRSMETMNTEKGRQIRHINMPAWK